MLGGLLGLMAGSFALYNTIRLGTKATKTFYNDIDKYAIYKEEYKEPEDTGYIYEYGNFTYKGNK